MRNVTTFDTAKLNHVETEEKVVLPSVEGKKRRVSKNQNFSDIAKEKTLEQITEFDMSKLKVAEAAKEVETEKPTEASVEEGSAEEDASSEDSSEEESD